MKQWLLKVRDKLGKAFIPALLVVFSLLLFAIVFGSVHEKKITIKEGQLADTTIRANKNIENTYETEQKKKLAAEAVTPEYIFQEDTAEAQHERIEKLFTLIGTANSKIDKAFESEKSAAKKDETIPQPTNEERVAALKSEFEKLNQEEVTLYQSFPSVFYQNIYNLTN